MLFDFAFERVREHEIIFDDLFGSFPVTSSQSKSILINERLGTMEESHFKLSIINDKYN